MSIRNLVSQRFILPALILVSASLAVAQGDPDTIRKIVDEGTKHNQVMNHLTYLTQKIGPRLTSSSNLDKAEKWAVGQFKKFGCTNVHLEQWGSFPVGFDRGKKSYGRMTSPETVEFEFTSPSWSEGTKGPLKGPAIMAPTTMEQFNAVKDKLKNAWVIFTTNPPRRRPGTAPTELTPEQKAQQDLAAAIDGAGIAGRVNASRSELTVTSGQWRDKTFESHPMDRSVTIRKSDMDKITADLTANKPVTLEFNLDQKWRKGPVPIYNVIAEIKGTEKPDEVVIVSGHLDSWDGPGSQGALDNGTGSCTAMEAARILCAVKAKPKRTIRFILWTGEEQGIFGSRAYIALHPNEMDKISAVLVDDGGTNYQGGYEGLDVWKPFFETAYAPSVAAFPAMPMKYVIHESAITRIGSDQDSFNAVGVPGFFTIETGRSDYNYIHHTQHDRLEFAIPEYLVQSSTNHAVVSYNLACADTMLPRAPKPANLPTTTGLPGFPPNGGH